MYKERISILRHATYALVAMVLIFFSSAVGFAQSSWKKLVEHEIKPGETVYSIARNYQASVDKIYQLNPWAKGTIKSGDKLIVPVNSAPAQDTLPSVYQVVAGDTLYSLCKKFGVSREEMLRANPQLTGTNLPVGMTLHIPRVGEKPTETELAPEESVVEEQRAVNVLIMLPLSKAPRYVEFYEGFLMGVNDLKKNGISIRLRVLDTPDDETFAQYVYNGELAGRDLVIGGVNDEQIRMIGDKGGYGYHVIPFSSYSDIDNASSRTIQINTSGQNLIDRAVPFILRKYRQSEFCFVRRGQDSDDPLVRKLKIELSNAGRGYSTVDLATGDLSSFGPDVVLVPVTPSKDLAQALMDRLSPSEQCTLLGYPQWQSYGDRFISSLHKSRGTIYTPFFFDANQAESKVFLSKFYVWYNKKIVSSFPKYGVLGYDLSRYFIRGWASYGKDFPSQASMLGKDGLQLDFSLGTISSGSAYVNNSMYFISFTPEGSIIRESL